MNQYFGLSTKKDGAYMYVMVICSACWSGLYFGWNICASMLTAQWKSSLGLPFKTASLHQTIYVPCRYLTGILATMFLNRFPGSVIKNLGSYLFTPFQKGLLA